MAVIANQNQNDQEKDKKGQNSLNPLKTVGTASSGNSAPGGSPQAQQQASNLASQQQSGSGRFTNLQKYLQANQGGSQRIAQNIENTYNKQADSVRQGIAQAQNQLTGQTNPLQQQLGEQGSQQLEQGFQDPNAVLGDQTQFQNFRNLYGGLTQNIANVAGVQNLQQQQLAQQNQALQNTGALAGTEQGRFQLLRNSVKAPNYAQGAQRLDQTLLQSQPSITNNLQTGLQRIAGDVNQNLSGLGGDTISRINALKGLSQQRQDQWGNLLTSGMDSSTDANEGQLNQQGLGDIGTAVQNQYNQLKQDLPNQLESYKSSFNSNVFTPEQLQALGLEKGMKTYGLSGADLMKSGNFNFNTNLNDFNTGGADQAAKQEQLNRYNALRQLAQRQQDPTMFTGETAGYNPLSFNKETLNKALTQRKSALDNDLYSAAQNALNEINRTASTAGTGTIWSDYSPFYRATSALRSQLDKGVGNMNADQIAAAIERLRQEGRNTQLNSSKGGFQAAGGYGRYNLSGGVQAALNNVYNTYNPAMSASIGEGTDTTPTPQVWVGDPSKMPTGGAGKGGYVLPKDDFPIKKK